MDERLWLGAFNDAAAVAEYLSRFPHPDSLDSVINDGKVTLGQLRDLGLIVQAYVEKEKPLERNLSRVIICDPDSILHIRGFDEPIELVRLRRTISNITNALSAMEAVDISDGVKRNYFVRANGSLIALNDLLKGDEVRSVFRDVNEEIKRERDKKSKLNSVEDIYSLALSKVYKEVKNLKASCAKIEAYSQAKQCEVILTMIREVSDQRIKSNE